MNGRTVSLTQVSSVSLTGSENGSEIFTVSSNDSDEEYGFFTKYYEIILIVLIVVMLIAAAVFLYAIIAGYFIYTYSWLSPKGLMGIGPDYWKIFFTNRMFVTFKVHPFSIVNTDDVQAISLGDFYHDFFFSNLYDQYLMRYGRSLPLTDHPVLKGNKPRIKEGPEVSYRVVFRKKNISYSYEEDDLSFEEICEPVLMENEDHSLKGKCRKEDSFTPVNVPLWLVLLHGYDFYGSRVKSELFNLLQDPKVAFGSQSSVSAIYNISSLLFGGAELFCESDIEVCVKIRSMIKKAKARHFALKDEGIDFSMFTPVYKNVNVTTAHFGLRDIKMAGQIKTLNGKTFISNWDNGSATSTCNKIRGTMHFFPGSGRGATDIEVWINDLWRPVTYKYNPGKSDNDYIHYEMNEGTFLNSDEKHKCYCKNNPKNVLWHRACYDGVMGLYDCVGSSIFVSFPHFLHASKELKQKLDGLVPNAKKHTSRIVMYRKNGTFIEFSIKYQFNVPIFAVPEIPELAKVPWAFVPILWLEQTLLVTADEMKEFIEISPYTRAYKEEMEPVKIFRFTAVAISLFVIIVCLFLIVVLMLKFKPPSDDLSEESDAEESTE